MKKILLILSGGLLMLKEWCQKHKVFLKKLGIGCAAVLLCVVVAIVGMYIYFSQKYPSKISLEGVYTDTSVMDFEFTDRDLAGDYDIESAIKIAESDGQISVSDVNNSEAITINDNSIVINSEGVYVLSGEFNGYTVLIEAKDTEKVQLVLNGCTLTNDVGPAMYIKSADKVFITLVEDTVSQICDGNEYEYIDGETNVDAAIFSKADLTINGNGTLKVSGNCAHGIVSKDDLVIGGGVYDISSVKKAVNGKDCVKIYSCDMKLNAGTDGISSNNEEDADRGFVYIQNGAFDIICGNDGIQAETVLKLENPGINICAGGGSINAPERVEEKRGRDEAEAEAAEAANENTESMKGLKAGLDIMINGGQYTIDTVDDAVHANNSIKIIAGSFELRSGDDGIHAENTLEVIDGTINIEKCYEGLEAYQIAISGGETFIISSDDGVNASAGLDDDGIGNSIKLLFAPCLNGKFEVTGGFLAVNTEGDGLDSNGVMTISSGKVYVAGPTSGGNDAFDCDHMTIECSEVEEGENFAVEITKERYAELLGQR